MCIYINTISHYIKQLIESGMLREMTGQVRNRVFLAEAILRAIDDPLPPEDDG